MWPRSMNTSGHQVRKTTSNHTWCELHGYKIQKPKSKFEHNLKMPKIKFEIESITQRLPWTNASIILEFKPPLND
jgi:hypothetical protein